MLPLGDRVPGLLGLLALPLALAEPCEVSACAVVVHCPWSQRPCTAPNLSNGSLARSSAVSFTAGLALEAIPLHTEIQEGQHLEQVVLIRLRAPTFAVLTPGATTTTTSAMKTTAPATTVAAATTFAPSTPPAATTAAPVLLTSTPAQEATADALKAITNATAAVNPDTTTTTTHPTANPSWPAVANAARKTASQTGCSPQHAAYTLYRAPPKTAVPQLPREDQDLAVVFDISKSMLSGSKLPRAKRVLTSIIKDLRDGDQMHFITAHSLVSVWFERIMGIRWREILGSIEQLESKLSAASRTEGGAAPEGTDLLGGITAAQRVLTGGSGGKGQLSRRILLFSDGLAAGDCPQHTALLERVEQLQRQGVFTSAFAPGLDYDRSLLPAIAEAGRGDFVALSSPEALEAAAATVVAPARSFATNAELWLTPLRGAELVRTYGHRRRGTREPRDFAGFGTATMVPLGTLRYFGTAEVLLDIHLPGLLVDSDYLFYELVLTSSGENETRIVLSGHVRMKVLRASLPARAPHPGIRLFRDLADLMSHDGGPRWAGREALRGRLLDLVAEATLVEAGDPAFRAVGLAKRALAAWERLL